MLEFYSNNELAHWGVKGMKWGHRKASIVSNQPHKRIPGMVIKDESQPKPRRIPGMVVKDESQPKPRINIPKTYNRAEKRQEQALLKIKKANKEAAASKVSKGKKIAAGILAGLGAATVAQVAIDIKRDPETYKAFVSSIPLLLTKL